MGNNEIYILEATAYYWAKEVTKMDVVADTSDTTDVDTVEKSDDETVEAVEAVEHVKTAVKSTRKVKS